MSGHTGRIAGRHARLERRDGRLTFVLGQQAWPMDDVVIDHRDEDGQITFRVVAHGGPDLVRLRYRRRGPGVLTVLLDAIDSTGDEPWGWEDSDFGLVVFHVATSTGPVKHRHLLGLPDPSPPIEHPLVRVDESGVRHQLAGVRAGFVEEVSWDALSEVTVKFEISGIWSARSVFVLREPWRLAVVPVGEAGGLPAGFAQRLEALPGFGARARAAVEDAVAYAREPEFPPTREWPERAERLVWRRAPA